MLLYPFFRRPIFGTLPASFGSIALLFATFHPGLSQAENELSEPRKKESFAILSERFESSFPASEVIFASEAGLAKVEILPALSISQSNIQGAEQSSRPRSTTYVAAAVPVSPAIGTSSARYGFALFGEDGNFTATQVRSFFPKSQALQTPSLGQLNLSIAELERKILLEKLDHSKVQKQLQAYRDQASTVAGVDGIIDLKLSLEKLRASIADKEKEIGRLKILVENSRQIDEPTNIGERQQELLMQLKEGAQTTAMADRLTARKQEAAAESFKRKLALVQQTQGIDAAALAQEVLRLRSIRKELERGRRPGNTEQPSEF